MLALGAVVGANFLFFAALKRIEAAPAAVAATIEPVVGTVLALVLFAQALTPMGWVGLMIVVGAVSGGYLLEARLTATDLTPAAPEAGYPRD
jgi:drug/metabolite transporter (DMT)-like permease